MTSYFATALLWASLLGAQCDDNVLELFPEFKQAVNKLAHVSNTVAHLKPRVNSIQTLVSQLQQSVDLQECPFGQTKWRGSCYYFGDGLVTWNQAKDKCIGIGGHLVKIDSSAENRMLLEEAKNSGWYDISNVWMGANDISGESEWRWVSDHSRLHFTYWAPGEPNNRKNEDCAALYINHDFQWNDMQCHARLYYICEKKL